MKNIAALSKEELLQAKKELEAQYKGYQEQGLKLDMSRGKPSGEQLDKTNGLLNGLPGHISEDGLDVRNYGAPEGLKEAKRLFSDLLDISMDKIVIGGNSSLNLMYDACVRLMLFGTQGHTPWCKLPEKVKFLCPSPGYDRHFGVCEDLGIEMIPVPMKEDGPDMDVVEELAAKDEMIKGIWCVPLYSNPTGACYSDEVVDRLAGMKTAAPDFRIFWDNAYGVHYVYQYMPLKDIFKACEEAGNPDRVYYFFSTSKITFPGAGVALIATSPENKKEIMKHMSMQTIGHDKINQLRVVSYFKDADGIRKQMGMLADDLKPKFDMVLELLEKELAGTGLLTWTKPLGGYFISVDTLPGCAKNTVALAKEAGVVMTGAGATYPYKKDPQDSNIRIAPTYPTVGELQKAMELFCVCVKLAGVNKLLEGK